jgi:phosphoribosylglycinamide formyltransferase-1
MRIGLITYDARHLKTEQIALGLHQKGYRDLSFFALPFVARAKREIVFPHRPDMELGAHSMSVAEAVGGSFTRVASPDEIDPQGADLFLITGAGILPESFVNATLGRVLNSHPGIIPLVRGLDAFKWAILDGMPVGNTLHFIDAEADAGEVVAQSPTPVFATDTLERFAERHYELEIDMMLDFERILSDRTAPGGSEPYETRPARMRMKAELQNKLYEAFEEYKRRFAMAGKAPDAVY